MESEAKYYTPRLEEFFIGFEFEHLNYEGKLVSDPQWNKKEWHKEICDADWFNILLDEYEHDEEAVKDYRVKYLDSKDIESLGFVGNKYYHVDCYEKDCWRIFWFNENMVSIEKFFKTETEQYFRGWIKNKSELKQVLKMIGVM